MAYIDDFFRALVEYGASDLHLSEGQPPRSGAMARSSRSARNRSRATR